MHNGLINNQSICGLGFVVVAACNAILLPGTACLIKESSLQAEVEALGAALEQRKRTKFLIGFFCDCTALADMIKHNGPFTSWRIEEKMVKVKHLLKRSPAVTVHTTRA